MAAAQTAVPYGNSPGSADLLDNFRQQQGFQQFVGDPHAYPPSHGQQFYPGASSGMHAPHGVQQAFGYPQHHGQYAVTRHM